MTVSPRPSIPSETPTLLADVIADWCGVYGGGPEFGDHDDDCPCRICFTIAVTNRIREAVANESRATHQELRWVERL